MRWPWRRPAAPAAEHWQPPAPIPDGDRVLGPSQQRWTDLLATQPEPLSFPLPPGGTTR